MFNSRVLQLTTTSSRVITAQRTDLLTKKGFLWQHSSMKPCRKFYNMHIWNMMRMDCHRTFTIMKMDVLPRGPLIKQLERCHLRWLHDAFPNITTFSIILKKACQYIELESLSISYQSTTHHDRLLHLLCQYVQIHNRSNTKKQIIQCRENSQIGEHHIRQCHIKTNVP